MNRPKLIITVGNIASGKTTWIKKFLAAKSVEELKNWIVLSKDALRKMLGVGKYLFDEKLEPIIHSCFIIMIQTFMMKDMDINIICDETNMDKETRKNLLELANNYGYEAIAVVIPKISRECAVERRCGLNDFAWGFSASIWRDVWERKQSKFEMPTKKEGFSEIWKVDSEDILTWKVE